MFKKAATTILLIFAIGLLLSSPAFSHTGSFSKLKCPVCGTKCRAGVTYSMTTMGTYRDLQKKGAIGFYYPEMIISCPSCHYAEYQDDFEKKVAPEIKKKVLEELKTINPGKKLDNAAECEFAARIFKWRNAKNRKIAYTYLVGSYLLRRAEGSDKQRRIKLQSQACDYFKKALKNNEIKDKEKTAVQYLVGDLYRRQGKFDEAIKWFNKSLKNKNIPDGLKKWIDEQKKLAEDKGDNNDI